jgi:hypothetical protein
MRMRIMRMGSRVVSVSVSTDSSVESELAIE